jgi:hypothetical protein
MAWPGRELLLAGGRCHPYRQEAVDAGEDRWYGAVGGGPFPAGARPKRHESRARARAYIRSTSSPRAGHAHGHRHGIGSRELQASATAGRALALGRHQRRRLWQRTNRTRCCCPRAPRSTPPATDISASGSSCTWTWRLDHSRATWAMDRPDAGATCSLPALYI